MSGLLRRTAGNGTKVQNSISTFINHVLMGTGSRKLSELADHIYPLIYEVHKVSPTSLNEVLPNICDQLQSEGKDLRLKIVKLLGRLFSSQHYNYGEEFPRCFKDYLGRFVDVSPEIRSEIIQSCVLVMKRKPELRIAVEGINLFFNI